MDKENVIMIICAVVYFFFEALICYVLWNAIVPRVIGWSGITYLQMCGVMLLVRFIPKGYIKFNTRKEE